MTYNQIHAHVIPQVSQELGNWRSPLLVQIESTILDCVYDLANGSIDVTQAFAHIINTLPWNDITALDAEDPTNVRFRRGPYQFS
jgi:hypothetical protein